MEKGTTFRVATAPQMRLFSDPTPSEAGNCAGLVRFVEDDPRTIFLGGRRLDEYVCKAQVVAIHRPEAALATDENLVAEIRHGRQGFRRSDSTHTGQLNVCRFVQRTARTKKDQEGEVSHTSSGVPIA